MVTKKGQNLVKKWSQSCEELKLTERCGKSVWRAEAHGTVALLVPRRCTCTFSPANRGFCRISRLIFRNPIFCRRELVKLSYLHHRLKWLAFVNNVTLRIVFAKFSLVQNLKIHQIFFSKYRWSVRVSAIDHSGFECTVSHQRHWKTDRDFWQVFSVDK